MWSSQKHSSHLLAGASDGPGTTLGSQACGTARVMLVVLHPNTMIEVFLLPLSRKGAQKHVQHQPADK